jgi:hypothetical protein
MAMKPADPDKWMRDAYPTLAPVVPPVDPDAEERRDQRIGNWIVGIAYGGGAILILGGLFAAARLL